MAEDRCRAALAEEETRPVAKLRLNLISSENQIAVSFALNDSPRLSNKIYFVEPRTMYRPQTVCGRYCPWEPTALKSYSSGFTSPLRIINFLTTTNNSKAKRVPRKISLKILAKHALFQQKQGFC
jgi:hypothetical protein